MSVHDLGAKKELCRREYFDFLGDSLQFSPDGSKFAVVEYISNGPEFRVSLYDTKTCQIASSLERFEEFSPKSVRIQFSDDGALILVRLGYAFHLFDSNSSKLVSSFSGASALLSPDGKTVVVEQTAKLQVFDTNGKQRTELKSDGYNYDFFEFSNDSSKLIYQRESVSDHKRRLYSFDLQSGVERVLVSDVEGSYSHGLSQTSPFYVVGVKDSGAHVFNFETGYSYKTSSQPGYLNDISFNHEGTMYVARVEAGYLRPTNIAVVENVITKTTVATIKESSAITRISFNPSLNQIVYVLEDENAVKVLDL